MAIQPRALNTTEAVVILETLSLLTAAQHQKSKLVIYETRIELESNSSTWRTLNALTAPIINNANYYAGYPVETGSRDISELSSLLARAKKAFEDQRFNSEETQHNDKRIDLAEKALKGLVSLVQNEYLSDSKKTIFVEQAQQKVKEIVEVLKNSSSRSSESENPLVSQLREHQKTIDGLKKEKEDLYKLIERKLDEGKDQEIIRLKDRVSHLEQQIEKDKTNAKDWLTLVNQTQRTAETEVEARHQQRIAELEQTIANTKPASWLQVLREQTQKHEKKLAEKDQLLAGMVLSNTVDLEKVPTETILAASRALTDVLTARLAKT